MGEWWTYLVSGLSTAVPVMVTAWALYRRQRRKDADAAVKVRKEQQTIDLDESREQQALMQQNESYNIREMKAFQRERQKIHEQDMALLVERHEQDKRDILGQLGQYVKKLEECEKGHAWGRVIIVRMVEVMRQKYSITPEQERDLFRPVEVWEKVQDDRRVEEAKQKEDDSVQ